MVGIARGHYSRGGRHYSDGGTSGVDTPSNEPWYSNSGGVDSSCLSGGVIGEYREPAWQTHTHTHIIF